MLGNRGEHLAPSGPCSGVPGSWVIAASGVRGQERKTGQEKAVVDLKKHGGSGFSRRDTSPTGR